MNETAKRLWSILDNPGDIIGMTNDEAIKRLFGGELTNDEVSRLAEDVQAYCRQQEEKQGRKWACFSVWLEGVRVGRGLEASDRLDRELKVS